MEYERQWIRQLHDGEASACGTVPVTTSCIHQSCDHVRITRGPSQITSILASAVCCVLVECCETRLDATSRGLIRLTRDLSNAKCADHADCERVVDCTVCILWVVPTATLKLIPMLVCAAARSLSLLEVLCVTHMQAIRNFIAYWF